MVAGQIRSGMSVQDLKQLTAQRAHQQRLELWKRSVYHSPLGSRVSFDAAPQSLSPSSTSSLSPSSSSSSTSPSSSFSFSSSSTTTSSPQQQKQTSPCTYYDYTAVLPHSTRMGGYRASSSSSSSFRPLMRCHSSSRTAVERMYITYGGQMVAFMAGVVNLPSTDYVAGTTLSPL